jgi:ABC-2 type transport system permease protein
MAVYKHRYTRYRGDLTAGWQRLLVLPRYAYRRVFRSRFFLAFFVLCFVAPLGAAVLIYLRHNLSALALLGIPAEAMLPVDAGFFKTLLGIQGGLAFLLTVFVGPGLVSPDLTHNALPLYFSRPFSRAQYVLGKLSVLFILLSAVTWIPLALLFLLQANLAGDGWMMENARILAAIVLGSWVWLLSLSLPALALSAWVRWRAVAGALLFAVFIVGRGFRHAFNEILVTRWGELFDINRMVQIIWNWLFLGEELESQRIRGVTIETIPVWSAWVGLGILFGFCLLLLARRLRAYEVVR